MKNSNIILLSFATIVFIILASLSNVAGYQIFQSTNLNDINKVTIGNNTITVDDEPGDADFTSIKEALNYSSPGDTIEVYSGTYFEQGIHIVKDNITLVGIAHELGGGGDSGKPFINGDGTAIVIHVQENHIIVSN